VVAVFSSVKVDVVIGITDVSDLAFPFSIFFLMVSCTFDIPDSRIDHIFGSKTVGFISAIFKIVLNEFFTSMFLDEPGLSFFG
jgi:hypothetical protein